MPCECNASMAARRVLSSFLSAFGRATNRAAKTEQNRRAPEQKRSKRKRTILVPNATGTNWHRLFDIWTFDYVVIMTFGHCDFRSVGQLDHSDISSLGHSVIRSIGSFGHLVF